MIIGPSASLGILAGVITALMIGFYLFRFAKLNRNRAGFPNWPIRTYIMGLIITAPFGLLVLLLRHFSFDYAEYVSELSLFLGWMGVAVFSLYHILAWPLIFHGLFKLFPTGDAKDFRS